MRLLAAMLPLTLLVFGPVPSGAQPASSGEARLGAVALEPVARDVSLKIELADNAELDVRLEGELRELLAARGWTSIKGPQWTLTLRTTEVAENTPESTLGEVRVDNDIVRMRMNLWSSSRDSVLGGRTGAEPATLERLLRLELELRDAADKVAWTGRAETTARGTDPYRIYRQMLPRLVDRLGQTADAEAFPIR
ncbi:MAG: hypothetical protein AB7N54_10910 [Alphaproteobacteria bacterium]